MMRVRQSSKRKLRENAGMANDGTRPLEKSAKAVRDLSDSLPALQVSVFARVSRNRFPLSGDTL
jgi:hypothetical protein